MLGRVVLHAHQPHSSVDLPVHLHTGAEYVRAVCPARVHCVYDHAFSILHVHHGVARQHTGVGVLPAALGEEGGGVQQDFGHAVLKGGGVQHRGIKPP